jgi:hypothetical protein
MALPMDDVLIHLIMSEPRDQSEVDRLFELDEALDNGFPNDYDGNEIGLGEFVIHLRHRDGEALLAAIVPTNTDHACPDREQKHKDLQRPRSDRSPGSDRAGVGSAGSRLPHEGDRGMRTIDQAAAVGLGFATRPGCYRVAHRNQRLKVRRCRLGGSI